MPDFLPSQNALPTGEERLPNRRAIVEFRSYANSADEVGKEILRLGGDGKQLDGIDVKFYVERVRNGTLPNAKISIANLAKSDIEFLSNWVPFTQGQWGRKAIRLFAGYDDDVSASNIASLIFAGDIWYATPTLPPDIWLECEGIEHKSLITSTLSKTLDIKTDVKGVCENVSKWLGYSLVWDDLIPDELNTIVEQFNYTGSGAGLVSRIKEAFGVDAYIENNNLYVVRPASAFVSDGGVIYAGGSGDTTKNRYDIECSQATGMIGIPKLNPVGVEVTMLLNPKIRPGQTMYLNSTLIPRANGIYNILRVVHEGHLRGQNFYSHIEATRVQTYLNNQGQYQNV